MSEIGHNSGLQLAKDQLLSIINRVETQEKLIKETQSDRADIYTEAKSAGYDVPALKAIVRMRREDPAKRHERETIMDTYRQALGMLD